MEIRSVYDVYELSKAVYPGFVHALPCNPLQFVAAIDDQPTPLLIIGHDCYNRRRVIKGVPRNINFDEHTTTILVMGPREAPQHLTWGAACFVDTYDGKNIVPRYPELKDQAALYDGLNKLKRWQKPWHPSIKLCVDGVVNYEGWRYFDNCMSIRLTEKQAAGALRAMEVWSASNHKYQVLGYEAPNCRRYSEAAVDGAEVPRPLGWAPPPFPFMDARIVDLIGGKKLRRIGPWHYQSSAVTARIQEELKQAPTATSEYHVGLSSLAPACV